MMEVQTFLDAQTSGRNPHLKIIPLFFRLPCKDFKARALNWVQKWKAWAISDDHINVVKWKEAVQKLKRIKGIEFQLGMTKVAYRRSIVQTICELVPTDNRTDLTYIHGIQRILKIMKPVMENLPCRATGVGKGARLFGISCHIQLGVGFSIVELQKKVLTELTQASNEWLEELTNSDIGQKYAKEHMTEHKVFLALDNVSDTQSLQDKDMVATSDYGEYHLMVKKLLVKNPLGSTALIFNQDVESIYVEEMGRKLSKWEVYDIFMFDFLKWGIEVDWRDFFPYLKWVPFKRFEDNLSHVDRRRDAAVKALVQEQKQLLASGKTSILGRPLVLTIPLIFSTAVMSCITGIHVTIKLERDLPNVEGDRLYGIKSLSISLGRKLVFWTCVSILPAMYSVAMVVGGTSSFVWTKGATTSGSHLGFRAS
eukprot:Gb_09826 [translate_table: standard]